MSEMAIDALHEWTRHHDWCEPGPGCSCGLTAALAALRAAPAPTVDVQAIAEIAWRCIRECKGYYGPPVMCPGHQQEAQALVGAVAEPIDPHVTGRAKCRMCNHVCQSVAPVGTDLDNLECPNCHRMTLEVAP
jgi:hypothetical protein